MTTRPTLLAGTTALAALLATTPAPAANAATAPATTSPMMSTAVAPAVTSSTVGTYLNTVKAYPNGVANQQGTYRGECVSLISHYLGKVYNIKTGAWGNAIDYRAGGTGGNQLKAHGFTWSTSTTFKDGDILVWGDGANTGPYGHVGIYYKGKVYDQNWNGRRTVGSHDFFPSAYLGKWRK